MRDRKYLIFIDILGFEDLLTEIGEETRLEPRKVRRDFIEVIREKISTLEAGRKICGKKYGESDDWLLVTDSLDKSFECIDSILNHHTGYIGHDKIPLEIGLGIAEYDPWAKFSSEYLTSEDETIKLLKMNIIKSFHRWYKEQNNGNSIRETFLVLTESAYNELEPLDRVTCKEIKLNNTKNGGNKEAVTFFLADIEKVQQRAKVFEFLEMIGVPGSKIYDRIDHLFVPPLEYDEIKEALSRDRILFITGTAEYGKTYTALRLLWEYFAKDYKAAWIEGGGPEERQEVRKKMENIERELKPQQIIYFEDPFGKTEYERREILEREIGTIIDSVKNVPDVYVIVTSREEVFKQFEKEQLSSKQLGKFEIKLNIKKPSYNDEKRKEILSKWAQAKACKWFDDVGLRMMVIKRLDNKKNLPTLLSIRNFVTATINVIERSELLEILKEKSRDTGKAFAREIETMTDDKVLFLSFPFIYNFPADFVETQYQKLIKKFKIQTNMDFTQMLEWFLDDKIEVREGKISFSHPSYLQALPDLLSKDGHLTEWNLSIFSNTLLYLAKKEEAAGAVIYVVANNFDRFPAKVGNLLTRLSLKEENAWAITKAIASNFEKLPSKVRDLLFNLSEKVNTARHVARAIASNFNKLPRDMQLLLFELAERPESERQVAGAVAYNFLNLPNKARNLLFKLAEKQETAGAVAWAIAKNFYKLPVEVTNLLYKLAEKDNLAQEVARAVANNYNQLPEKAQNLLFQLSEKDETVGAVVFAIAHNYEKLPENIKNLFVQFSQRDDLAWAVARAVASNFDKLPSNIGNLLFKLSERDECAEQVAWSVAHNFITLPVSARHLLFELSERERVAGAVALAISNNFEKLPEEARQLLYRLSGREEAATQIAAGIDQNFEKIPENMRVELLLKVSEKDKAAVATAWAVTNNFEQLPPKVRIQLLLKLSENNRAAEHIAGFVIDNFQKIPQRARDQLLLKLLEKGNTVRVIASFLEINFNRLPQEFRNSLLLKLSVMKDASDCVTLLVAQNFDKLPSKVRNLLDVLQDHLRHILIRLSTSNSYLQKMQAIQIIASIESKLSNDFIVLIYEILAKDSNKRVSKKAKELLSYIEKDDQY